MNTTTKIDLNRGDFAHAWECHYTKDDKYIRNIMFGAEDRFDSDTEVSLNMKDEAEFKRYIEFFNIPPERVRITSSDC